MSLPTLYYPSWWNVNDGRTSYQLGYHTSTAYQNRSEKSSRCYNGHFGRVAACAFNFSDGKIYSQCSLDHDVFASSYCVPIFAGDSKNEKDDVLGQQKSDLAQIKKVANSLVASSGLRGNAEGIEKTLKKLRDTISNRKIEESIELCQFLPERTSFLLQDRESAEVMWNEERLSNALSSVNQSFTGGSLIPQSTINQNEVNLLHSCGQNLQTLKRHVYFRDKRILGNENGSLNFDSSICEIDSRSFIRPSKTPNVVVRDLFQSLSFIQSDDDEFRIIERKEFDAMKQMNSVRLSPYLSSDFVIAADGRCFLYDLDRNDPVFTSEVTHSLVYSFNDWCFSCFSNNLWNLLFIDNSIFRLIDTRQSSECMELFSITNSTIYTQGEVLTSLVSRPDILDNYHIIASSNNMIMLDQRMPQVPVLHWTNSLLSDPSIAFVSGNRESLWYLAGRQKTKDFCVNCINLRTGSKMPPQLVASGVGGSPVSFADSLQNSLSQSLVAERFDSTSLLSICALPDNVQSMDCLLLFSNGDITRQTFQLDSSASERPSLTLSDSESVETHKWLEKLLKMQDNEDGDTSHDSNSNEPETFFTEVHDENISFIQDDQTSVCSDLFSSHIGVLHQSDLTADSHSKLLALDLEKFLQSCIGECGSIVDEGMNEKKIFKLKKKRINEESMLTSLISSNTLRNCEEAKIERLARKRLRK